MTMKESDQESNHKVKVQTFVISIFQGSKDQVSRKNDTTVENFFPLFKTGGSCQQCRNHLDLQSQYIDTSNVISLQKTIQSCVPFLPTINGRKQKTAMFGDQGFYERGINFPQKENEQFYILKATMSVSLDQERKTWWNGWTA